MSRLWFRSWVGAGGRGAWLVAALLLAGSSMVGCGSGDGDVSVRRAPGTAVASGGWLAGLEPGDEAAGGPAETATPEPTIHTIEDLVAQYGYPPGYDYAWLRIPKIGVDAPVGLGIVDGDAMGAPLDPATVMVYDFRSWPDLGGLPGQGKNAVFSGHVDLSSYLSYADVTYHGQAVFSNLTLLVPGDVILVDANGATLEYMVTSLEHVGVNDGERWSQLLSSDVAVDSVTLYTCGGEFDSTSRTYADRVVVRAERN